jgi:predicted metal-dependent hydrolase
LAATALEVRRLMEWHAVEEMEHQSVASDLYRHLYGASPRHRIRHALALVKACHVLVTAISRVETIMLQSDPALTAAQRQAHRRYLFGRPGLAWRVALKLPRFFAPGFRHWSNAHDHALIKHGLERVYSTASVAA